MSDDEVLIEYLQLLSLEQTSLTRAAKQWLQAAIVSYRRGLADALAANATSAANTTNATAGSTNKTAAASARSGPSLPPLLTALDRSLTVRALLDEESAYPLPRARSTVFAAEDFAVVMASVLQAYGVHSRVAVLCSLPAEPPRERRTLRPSPLWGRAVVPRRTGRRRRRRANPRRRCASAARLPSCRPRRVAS